jgi:tetratricopeptide (TPR) repeat protein
MMIKQNKLLSLAFLIIIVAAISIYIYRDLNSSIPKALSQIENDQKEQVLLETSKPGGGYKIEAVDTVNNQKGIEQLSKMPDLNLSVVNYSHIDEATFKVASQNIAILGADLKKDPKDESKWLNLGIFRKMIGDYQGSVEIFNFVGILWPSDYVPFNNLADLYQFYIKNYPLAEKNWLKVIELKSDYGEAYENLYNLYKESYKEKEAQALPVLLKGVKNNPGSISLLVYTARYYRSVGEKAQALAYYKKAIDKAAADKSDQILSELKAESETLR